MTTWPYLPLLHAGTLYGESYIMAWHCRSAVSCASLDRVALPPAAYTPHRDSVHFRLHLLLLCS